ncbi:hypothetical protein [Candidatus Poriferisodalis sp.]|uniref:hypothetical protein n=1 Tax=Candidatus Poriferisodalis sp. TaxID=3101277 RepID=UPI003B01B865
MPMRRFAACFSVALFIAGCSNSIEADAPPEPSLTTYALTVGFYNVITYEPLLEPQCDRVTGRGSAFDDVPNATYSLVGQTRNIIGILYPVAERQPSCTFVFTGEFESLPDLLLIQGPRMQQNGFPVRSIDWSENRAVAGMAEVTVLAELELTVNLSDFNPYG